MAQMKAYTIPMKNWALIYERGLLCKMFCKIQCDSMGCWKIPLRCSPIKRCNGNLGQLQSSNAMPKVPIRWDFGELIPWRFGAIIRQVKVTVFPFFRSIP